MSVVSGVVGAIASNDAASAQADATEYGADIQYKMYQQGRKDQAPWREAGAKALGTLQEKIAAGPGVFTESPNYKFNVEEGQKAIERATAARGGVGGGRMAREMTRYSQGLASNEYQNYLNNYYQSLTPYQSLAGIGQTSAAQTAQSGAATGQGMSTAYQNAGNAQAAGAINQANAITGAANTGLNTYLAWKNLNNVGNSVAATQSEIEAAKLAAIM